jgi:hypothetical protein
LDTPTVLEVLRVAHCLHQLRRKLGFA